MVNKVKLHEFPMNKIENMRDLMGTLLLKNGSVYILTRTKDTTMGIDHIQITNIETGNIWNEELTEHMDEEADNFLARLRKEGFDILGIGTKLSIEVK